jgi:hypothetical protein
MTAESASGLVAVALLFALLVGDEVLRWAERQVSVRIRASWRALRRKDQS